MPISSKTKPSLDAACDLLSKEPKKLKTYFKTNLPTTCDQVKAPSAFFTQTITYRV